MSTFNDWLDKARNYDPETDSETPLDTIYSNLESSYTDLRDGSTGAISQKEEKIKEYESEISRLKSVNYDLMIQSPATEKQDDEPSAPVKNGVDSLFKSERIYR